MNSSTSNALGNGRHRRQISTPAAPFDAPFMGNMQPRRSHRRGQTMDYSSFSHQATMDRHQPKTVSQLRDYFNEKSGFQSQRDVQQYQSYAQQPEQSFFPSGMHIQQPYQYQNEPSLGSDCQAFNQEQLQAIHTTTGSPAPSSVGAPALSRSASESSENTPLKLALHRMQQEQFSNQQHQHFAGNADWELFPQPNMPMVQNEQVTAYAGPMHPVSVQPKAPSAKILSQISTACRELFVLLFG
jgi:regulatory protein SWI5